MYKEIHDLISKYQTTGGRRVIFEHIILRNAGWVVMYHVVDHGERVEDRCAYVQMAGLRLQWDQLTEMYPGAMSRAADMRAQEMEEGETGR